MIDTYGNETRELTGTQTAFGKPWRKDRRWWLRWPAKAWWLTGQRWPHREERSEYQPASHWSVRWLENVRRTLQRSRVSESIVGPLLQSKLNCLLIFLPIAIASARIPMAPDVVLVSCFLAIIPLSDLVQFSCEHLSASMRHLTGGMLVAFSDNCVELVVSIPRRILELY